MSTNKRRKLTPMTSLAKNTPSTQPYRMMIPQAGPHRYTHIHTHQAEQWLLGASPLFTKSEGEMSQYQTCLFHDPGTDLIVHNHSNTSSKNNTSPVAPPTKPSPPQSTPKSTNSMPPKKKLTLASYKSKRKLAAEQTPQPQDAAQQHAEESTPHNPPKRSSSSIPDLPPKLTPLPTDPILSSPLSSTLPDNITKTLDHFTRQRLLMQQERLEGLGKELKHSSTAHSEAGNPTLAALEAVESLMAFMLAFVCCEEALHVKKKGEGGRERGGRGDGGRDERDAPSQRDPLTPRDAPPQAPKTSCPALKNWHSLSNYLPFVSAKCEAFPLLHGLMAHLFVSVLAHILSIEPDGKSCAKLVRCVDLADRELGLEVLMDQFGAVWDGRVKDFGECVVDKWGFGDGRFDGKYRLPVGAHLKPVLAVRAGMRILEAWVGKYFDEGGYMFRLKL
ncbi:hypothetical protein K470DRAFT_260667 [Piedraia hortae CBS 480.64]|uniref:Uncharacterized protein n=1 Tax=Piedraia hortae CBS 480.64 TaxID=1314780 RepID=A0A6A7BSA3_9PEZI|nr:hypothetical protein K470DRAFT_260667 [Piedraia hortae CBS 480.64]